MTRRPTTKSRRATTTGELWTRGDLNDMNIKWGLRAKGVNSSECTLQPRNTINVMRRTTTVGGSKATIREGFEYSNYKYVYVPMYTLDVGMGSCVAIWSSRANDWINWIQMCIMRILLLQKQESISEKNWISRFDFVDMQHSFYEMRVNGNENLELIWYCRNIARVDSDRVSLAS